MAWFSNIPINRKLTTVIVATCAAVLLVAGLAIITTQLITARQRLVQEMYVLADLLGRNATAPLAFHRDEDREEIAKLLSAVQVDPRILAVGIYDTDGTPFGSYQRSDQQVQLPSTSPAVGYRFSRDHLELVRSLFLENQLLGTIYLRADLQPIYNELTIYAGIVALVLLAAVLIAIIISPRLRRPIAGPILALADVARRVAERKDYSARGVKQGNDEIGLLTEAFNQMLGEIEQAQSSLQKANQSMQVEITERKAVEQQLLGAHDELKTAKEAAEAANRAKDQFLAVLSHELRTPLTPVLLTVTLLERNPHLPEEVQEDIRTIRHHVELEARLIDDLLDLTRITRGKLRLNIEVVDAHRLIHEAVEICCAHRAPQTQLRLEASQHHVGADPARLLQVFWNLLNNAVKFTPSAGSITVRTSNDSPNVLKVQVIDTGAGIDPVALPRIFQAFEQADSTRTRLFGGLGLGLAIVRALVQAHGGTVRADSPGKGRGATFTVEIPTVAAPSTTATPPRKRIAPAANPPHLRILLVEDHDRTLALLTQLLEGLGHNVRSAQTVRQALALAESERIDLVISDLGLPDGSGLDVMRTLRQRQGIKGIALSGFGMDDDVRQCLEAGFSKHLTKPIDLSKLESAIEQATN